MFFVCFFFIGWAHVVCALYIPEVEFANVSTMEPIVLQSVPHERYNKVTWIIPSFRRRTATVEMVCLIWVLFCVRLDMLHLRGPGEGEQSSHWSLYDLQQTWLQTGLPCHMVRRAHMTQASKDKETDCSFTSSLRRPLRRAGLSIKSNLNGLTLPAPTGKPETSLQSDKSYVFICVEHSLVF